MFHPEILRGSPEWGVKQGKGGVGKRSVALNVNIQKTVGDTAEDTINDYNV